MPCCSLVRALGFLAHPSSACFWARARASARLRPSLGPGVALQPPPRAAARAPQVWDLGELRHKGSQAMAAAVLAVGQLLLQGALLVLFLSKDRLTAFPQSA